MKDYHSIYRKAGPVKVYRYRCDKKHRKGWQVWKGAAKCYCGVTLHTRLTTI